MESAAEQAIFIGVNVFIFIIALTCSILLMTNVLNMSEAANKVMTEQGNSTLMNLYGDGKERIYTGDELLAIILEYTSESSKMNEKMVLYAQKEGGMITEVTAQTMSIIDFKSSYELLYDGVDGNNRNIYLFIKK